MIRFSLFRTVLWSIAVVVSSRIGRSLSLANAPSSSHRKTSESPTLDGMDWMQDREEVRRIFREEIFGIVPSVDGTTSFAIVARNPTAMGGKATLFVVEVTFLVNQKEQRNEIDSFCFPIRLFVPNDSGTTQSKQHQQQQHSVFLFICNRSEDEILGEDESVSEYWPVEEILGSGFATAAFWAGDVDPDDQNDDFANGIHPLLDQGKRTDRSWGAIAAWAWGASRVLDVLHQGSKIFRVDPTKVSVIGHSRGGKTALWAAVEDERFAMAVSNNSGCTGAALSKRKASGKFGETVQQINTVFPNWFCKRYRTYNENEDKLQVDQHMLLTLLAPRAISVASATEDDWADPLGEYLSIREASKIWSQIFGVGSPLPEEQPPPEHPIDSGSIHYHLRSGPHDLNLYDWKRHMEAFERGNRNQ